MSALSVLLHHNYTPSDALNRNDFQSRNLPARTKFSASEIGNVINPQTSSELYPTPHRLHQRPHLEQRVFETALDLVMSSGKTDLVILVFIKFSDQSQKITEIEGMASMQQSKA